MFNRILFVTTVATCLATAAGFLARSWWVFELFSHFRVQYFVVLAGCGIIFLARKKHREVVLAIAFAVVNYSVVGNYHVEPSAQASIAAGEGRTIRALLVNVNQGNQAHEKLHRFVRFMNADLMVLVEVNQDWMSSLRPLFQQYPYNTSKPNGTGGIALLSRIPFDDATIEIIGGVGLPSVIARFTIDGQKLTLIGTHPRPPTSRARAKSRNHQLAELAEFVSARQEPTILLGDLNVTPWSPFFRDFLRSTGLRDSREGFGLQPSWPTRFPPVWIPIDHALVSSNVVVHDRRVGPYIGSDHYPVVIDFSITARSKELRIINRRFTQMNADDNSPESRRAKGNKSRQLTNAKRNTSRQLSAITSQQDSKEKSGPRFDGWEVMMGPRLRAKSKI